MALSPALAKYLPRKLAAFCAGLRYPHVFLASIPVFVIALVSFQRIPYGDVVAIGLGLLLYVSSKLR